MFFCSKQDKSIENFKPQNYFKVVAEVKDTKNYQVSIQYPDDKLEEESKATEIESDVKSEEFTEVVNIQAKKTIDKKPPGLNTVEMLKLCSTIHKFSADKTMKLAENLYRNGAISYPRTESTCYSENFDFNEILEHHSDHPHWGDYVIRLIDDGVNKENSGNDMGDHPPITPVSCLKQDELEEDEWKVYMIVARYFLASVSPNAEYEDRIIEFQVGNHKFILCQREVENEGFYEILPTRKGMENSNYKITDFEFKIGEKYPISSIKSQEWKTEPPRPLTESDLISSMEAKGIGTDASIPQHIKNIQTRGYINLESEDSREFKMSDFGAALAEGYLEIDEELIEPQVRAFIEENCNKIAKCQIQYEKVLETLIQIFKKKLEYFIRNFDKIEQKMKHLCDTKKAKS